MTDSQHYSPYPSGNQDAILEVLRQHLPERGLVLEIGSGTGAHVFHFAQACPDLFFQPSDIDAAARSRINRSSIPLLNIRVALALDAASPDYWPILHADAVLCINMIHRAPLAAAAGLMNGAARVLPLGGMLYLYGPFRRGGRHAAFSIERFDTSLRRRNPAWGVRDLEEVAALASGQGFAAPLIEEMPANNLSLIFRRSA